MASGCLKNSYWVVASISRGLAKECSVYPRSKFTELGVNPKVTPQLRNNNCGLYMAYLAGCFTWRKRMAVLSSRFEISHHRIGSTNFNDRTVVGCELAHRVGGVPAG
jgi:hypothetical protein